jgi:hypothetical protein
MLTPRENTLDHQKFKAYLLVETSFTHLQASRDHFSIFGAFYAGL